MAINRFNNSDQNNGQLMYVRFARKTFVKFRKGGLRLGSRKQFNNGSRRN